MRINETKYTPESRYEDTLYDIGQAVERELAMLSTEDLDAMEKDQLDHIAEWCKGEEGRG